MDNADILQKINLYNSRSTQPVRCELCIIQLAGIYIWGEVCNQLRLWIYLTNCRSGQLVYVYFYEKHGGKCHCVLRQICLYVLLLDLCPVVVVLLFRGETQIWLEDWVVLVFWLLVGFLYFMFWFLSFHGPIESLYKIVFHIYISVRTES